MAGSASEARTCVDEEAVANDGAAVGIGGVQPVCVGGQQLRPLILAKRPWSGAHLNPPACQKSPLDKGFACRPPLRLQHAHRPREMVSAS